MLFISFEALDSMDQFQHQMQVDVERKTLILLVLLGNQEELKVREIVTLGHW